MHVDEARHHSSATSVNDLPAGHSQILGRNCRYQIARDDNVRVFNQLLIHTIKYVHIREQDRSLFLRKGM